MEPSTLKLALRTIATCGKGDYLSVHACDIKRDGYIGLASPDELRAFTDAVTRPTRAQLTLSVVFIDTLSDAHYQAVMSQWVPCFAKVRFHWKRGVAFRPVDRLPATSLVQDVTYSMWTHPRPPQLLAYEKYLKELNV